MGEILSLKFKCGWCWHEFKDRIGQFKSQVVDISKLDKGRQNGTNHVTCPKCLNFIPWRSGE